MPIFTGAVAAVTAAVAWVGSTLAAGGAAALFLRGAIYVGASLISRALAGKPDVSGQRAGIVGQIQQGADTPRSFILGRYATAGSLVYHNQWGKAGDVPNAYYTRVTAISDIPVSGLAGVIIDGERCTIDWSNPDPDGRGYPIADYAETREVTKITGGTTAGGFLTATTTTEEVVGDAHAWIKFYDGTQTNADAFLVSDVSSDDRPWDASRIGRGVAYAVVTFKFNREMFQGLPRVLYEIDGAPLFDPSTGSVGTGDDLPLVQIAAILRGISHDGQWLYGPQNRTGLRIVDAEWAVGINKCRAAVPGATTASEALREQAFGTTDVPARYRSGLEVSVDTKIVDVLDDLLTACNGRLTPCADRIRADVGDPAPSSFTFHDDDIRTTHQQSYTPFLPLADTVNGITATYPDPEQAWANQSAPPLYVPEYEEADGNRRLTASLALRAVYSEEQVQRLLKTALAEARRARRHTIVLPSAYNGIEPGDFGDWTSPRNRYDAKQMRVDAAEVLRDGDIIVDLVEVHPLDYDTDFKTDYRPVARGSIIGGRPEAIAVPGFDAEGIVVLDHAGRPRYAGALLSWTPTSDMAGLQYQIRERLTGALLPPGSTFDWEAGGHVVSAGIASLGQYEARARHIPVTNRPVLWTGWAPFDAPRAGDVTVDDLSEDIWQAIEDNAADTAQAVVDNASETADLIQLSDLVNQWHRRREIRDNSAEVHRQAVERLNEDGRAQAKDRLDLSARIGDAVSAITVVREAIANEALARATQITALSSELQDDIGTKASSSIVEALQTEVELIDGELSSSAAYLLEVESVLGDTASKITQAIRSESGTDNAVSMTINSNGHITGYGIISEVAEGGDPVGAMAIIADRFFIVGPDGSSENPFAVYTTPTTINGITYEPGTYIKRARIGVADIETAMIGENEITFEAFAERTAGPEAANLDTTWREVITCRANDIRGGHRVEIEFITQFSGPYDGSPSSGGIPLGHFSMRLFRNGALIKDNMAIGTELSSSSHIVKIHDRNPPPGNHLYELRARCRAGGLWGVMGERSLQIKEHRRS
jgi:hypothetical protein